MLRTVSSKALKQQSAVLCRGGTRRWGSSSAHGAADDAVYDKATFNTPFWKGVAIFTATSFAYYQFFAKHGETRTYKNIVEEAKAIANGTEIPEDKPFILTWREHNSMTPTEAKKSAEAAFQKAFDATQSRRLFADYERPSVRNPTDRSSLDISSPNGVEPGMQIDTSNVIPKHRYIRRLLEQAEADAEAEA